MKVKIEYGSESITINNMSSLLKVYINDELVYDGVDLYLKHILEEHRKLMGYIDSHDADGNQKASE